MSQAGATGRPWTGQRAILHLDLDAFFASVEQRDKPSLRGKAVVVGGVGGRGVVATASYEARAAGVGSAMPTAEARRLAPHAAYLGGRFDAYRQSSRIVMALLRELSPACEALSIDEAFVDVGAGGSDISTVESLTDTAVRLRAEVAERTEGLTASVGIGTSKFIAKLGSELAKPDGLRVIEPGTEADLIAPMSVRALPGVGPATHDKLQRLGLSTVADVRAASEKELLRELGQAVGSSVMALAWARDERPVAADRETKSISVEDTFATDQRDRADLEQIVRRYAVQITERVQRAGLFARTVTLKVRWGDFTTWTRSRSLSGATDQPQRVAAIAVELLSHLDLREGVRLLGLGLSNFAHTGQEELFEISAGLDTTSSGRSLEPSGVGRSLLSYPPGCEVVHHDHGRGWVWGSGHGRVTVRFETRYHPGGRVRSFAVDDPQLARAELLPMAHDPGEDEG